MEQKHFRDVLDVILERKHSGSSESYVNSLMRAGVDRILKKIGEEATEVVIASKNQDHQEIIHEIADLFFHTFVLMAHHNLSIDSIEQEFGRRFGTPGLSKEKNI